MRNLKMQESKVVSFLLLLVAGSLALHQGCVNSSWCTEENSYCNPSGFCACKPGFTELLIGWNTYACITTPSIVGGLCNEDNHCSAPATCDKAAVTCTCPSETHLPSLNQTNCLPFATKLGDVCREPAVCDRLPNTECFSGHCVCKTGHIPNEEHESCLKMAVRLSDECIEDVQCESLLGEESSCLKGQCFCKTGHAFDASRSACHPLAKAVGDACEINEQCVFNLGHARCKGTSCRCITGYVPNEDGTDCVLV